MAAGLGLAATQPASAATVGVPGNYSTIQEAVDQAATGATIEVAPGTYDEIVEIPQGKALTLLGDPGGGTPGPGPDAPVMDHGSAAGPAFFLPGATADPVEIRGFSIRHYGSQPDTAGQNGHGVSTSYRSAVTVEDCEFHAIAGPAVAIYGDGQYNPADWVVRRNTFSAIGHSAVHLSANDGAQVANNVIESGAIDVGDSPGRWWEEGTEDNNPKAGIEVHATGRNGFSATLSGIEILGNRITGTYDDTGIRVLSINKNVAADGETGTETLATDITIRDNVVEITDELDDDGDGEVLGDPGEDERDESGILIGANPEEGQPAYVETVEVVGNTTIGARAGVGLATRVEGGISDVSIEANELRDGIRGIGLNSHARNGLSQVKVRGNRSSGNLVGLSLYNGAPNDTPVGPAGSPYDAVLVTENHLVDNARVGLAAIGDRDLDGVIVHRNDVADNGLGGAFNGTEDGTLSASCNFWGHATGPHSPDNPKGRGNGVGSTEDAAIVFEPWLPQSFTRVPEQACKLENHRSD